MVDRAIDLTDMALPAGETCGSCAHWRRCLALIQDRDPGERHCDFSPSRFRAALRARAQETK